MDAERLSELLHEWFKAELKAKTVVSSSRTTHGSAYHRECVHDAASARQQLVEYFIDPTS